MSNDLRRVEVSVTIRLTFSTQFVDEAQALTHTAEIVEDALHGIESVVDNEFVEGVYARRLDAVEMQAFRTEAE